MKLLSIAMLFCAMAQSQTTVESGPPLALYRISPTVTVTPAISPSFDFGPMAILIHRLKAETMVKITITYTSGAKQVNLATLYATGSEIPALTVWRVGMYIGLRPDAIQSVEYAVLTPGTTQPAALAQ